MSLSSVPSQDAPAAAAPKTGVRAALRRFEKPALLATAVGAFALVAMPASAAECVNGYRTLGNQIVVVCKDATGARAHGASARKAEPVTTGSIGTPRTPHTGPMTVRDLSQCQPGRYRVISLENGELMLPCGR